MGVALILHIITLGFVFAVAGFPLSAENDKLRFFGIGLAKAFIVFTIAVFVQLILMQKTMTVFPLVLLFAMTLRGGRSLFKNHQQFKKLLAEGLTFTIATIVIALPFTQHLAPPDVDASLYGYFALLLKQGTYPNFQAWGAGFDHFFLIPTVGFESLISAHEQIFTTGIQESTMILCLFSVVASLFSCFELIKKEFRRLPNIVLVAGLVFFFNSSYLWEYGDGSYNRTLATFMAVVASTFLLDLKGKKQNWLWFFISWAMIFVFHYRFFIWYSAGFGLYIVLVARSQVRRDKKKVALGVLTLVSLIGFSLIYHFANIDVIQSSRGVLTMFDQKHNLSAAQLWGDWLRFQPTIIQCLCGFMVILSLMRWGQTTKTLKLGVLLYLTMLFFSFDTMVLLVFPWTKNILYSQVAILANQSVAKLLLGMGFIEWSAPFFEKRISFFKPLAGLAWLLTSAIVLWEFNNSPFPAHALVQINLMKYYFGFCALLGAAGFWWFQRRNFSAAGAQVVCLLCLLAIQLKNGTFNYPYITRSDYEAMQWLKENTPPKGTLVLNYSYMDIDSQIELTNFKSIETPQSRYSIATPETYWVPVISERLSIFSRGLMIHRGLGSYAMTGTNYPEFESLDMAYWNIQRPTSCDLLKQSGITHVFVSQNVYPYVSKRFAQSPCLEAVFSKLSASDFHQIPHPQGQASRFSEIYRLRNN